MNRLLIGALFAAVCCAAAPVWATAAAPISLHDFRIGLAGCFQVGIWTPASVKVVGTSAVPAKLVVIAPDADGQLVRSEGPELTLVPGQPRELTARFCSGRQSGDITFRIEAGGDVIERKFRPGTGPEAGLTYELKRGFRQDVSFWGLCGVSENLLSDPLMGAKPDVDANTATGAAVVSEDQLPQILRLDTAEIPEDAADLAALDLFVFAAGAMTETKPGAGPTPLFAQLSDGQNRALREWVQGRGGHLVISLGSHVPEFQASKLGQWLKLSLQTGDEVRQLSGLEAFSGGEQQPLKMDRPVSIAQLQGPAPGQVLAQSLGVPLLFQMPSGFGRVSFIAVDLDRPPMSNWAGADLMVRRLQKGDRSDLSRDLRTQTTQLAKSGVNDLSSQLYTAEEDFPGVSRLSLWVVMLLLAAYILIVGPFDYVLVHRWLKRPNLTWITLPVWVLGGGVLALLLANSTNGTRLLANQLEIVDVDASARIARGRSWMTLYSPKTSRRAIELDTSSSEWLRDPQQREFVPAMNWLALAENRVGGLYREGGVQLTQRQYRRNLDGAGIADYPLQVWSTGRFGAEWSAEAAPLVDSKLTSSGFGQLIGTIKLRLPETLEDCLLAFGNRVYFPVVTMDRKRTSNLPKFYTWEIGRGQTAEQRELRGFLNEIYTKQVKRDNSKTGVEVADFSKPYDRSRRDLPYIMRMVTFYQSAGGRDYTGLRDDVLEGLDLSQQLRMGRAVLMGRLRKSSARWKVDGEPVADSEPLTYVRMVLPVEKDATSGYKALVKPDERDKGTTLPEEQDEEKRQ